MDVACTVSDSDVFTCSPFLCRCVILIAIGVQAK